MRRRDLVFLIVVLGGMLLWSLTARVGRGLARLRAMRLILVALLVGCGSEPSVSPPPCDGTEWVQAQQLLVAEPPVRGIRASLSAFDPVRQFVPCLGHYGAYSSVFVNVSRLDRRVRLGGDLIQLGLIHEAGESPTFTYTEDSTGGVGIALGDPRPAAGTSYTFTIESDLGVWWLTIADTDSGATLHSLTIPATWTTGASAWVMFETYDHASILGSASQASAPTVSGQAVAAAAGWGGVTGACAVQRVESDGAGGYLTIAGAAHITCSVADNGGFRASQTP